jgi:drug/metabolite transporter (DMT)-like permease
VPPSAANTQAHRLRGYLCIAGATFGWGVSAAIGKAVFTGRLLGGHHATEIDPLILSQTRTTFGFFMLLPILLMTRGRRLLAFRPIDWCKCMVMGAAGISGSNFFYYVAIKRTTIAIGITMQYLAPIVVLLYMVAVHRQRPTLQRIAGVLVAVLGSAMTIGLFHTEWRLNMVGVAAGIASAVAFAFYNVMGHGLLEHYDRWTVFMFAMMGSAIAWLFVNPPWRIAAAHYTAAQWGFMFLFSAFASVLAYGLYFAGLQYLDPTRAIVASCLEAVFAVVIAIVYPGEVPSLLQVAGIVLVLTATIVVQLPGREAVAEDMGLPGG